MPVYETSAPFPSLRAEGGKWYQVADGGRGMVDVMVVRAGRGWLVRAIHENSVALCFVPAKKWNEGRGQDSPDAG
jgi:hypothetical protein